MPEIKLIATDLDGTLIGRAREFHLYDEFRTVINGIRRDHNGIWAVCTSRRMSSFRRFFKPMWTMGLMPDFAVVKHAYVHKLTRFGYVPRIFWNLHMAWIQWQSQLYARRAMNQWHELVLRTWPAVKTLSRDRHRLRVRFRQESDVAAAAELLGREVKAYQHLRLFCYRMELDIRSVPFTKGLAVTEIARHLAIGPEHILAIGNGHNDASMLDGHAAAMTGCPRNSDPEIVQLVHESGGHISDEPSLSGTLDVIKAHRANAARSEIPDWWQDPRTFDLGEPQRRSHRSDPDVRTNAVRNMMLFGAVVYVVLLVFASFDVLPFSGIIRKPFDVFLAIVKRVLMLFQEG